MRSTSFFFYLLLFSSCHFYFIGLDFKTREMHLTLELKQMLLVIATPASSGGGFLYDGSQHVSHLYNRS